MATDELNSTPVALFDLDGTLLRTDSFLAFFCRYACRRRNLPALLQAPVWMAAYACRVLGDRAAKEQMCRALLAGAAVADVARFAEEFAVTWASRQTNPLLKERLEWHRQAGHRLILMSASVDAYVQQIGWELGIAEVLCTRLKVDGARYRGTFDGPNLKGVEKLRLAQHYLGRELAPPQSYAYGDSPSDLHLLRWVTEGYLYRKGRLVRVD